MLESAEVLTFDGPEPATDPAARGGVERILADVLADVLQVEQVPLDGHFFDDLGADSLVMAQFCARLRKRADLPKVSIKDVYRHSTIHGLAAAFAMPLPLQQAAPVAVAPPSPPPTITDRR